MTGITLEQWGSKYFEDIWPEAERQNLLDQFNTVMTTGKPCYLEDFHYSDDRLQGAFRIHAFRLPERRLAVSFEDISECTRIRQELEVSERNYRTLFETMAQGVVYQDRHGRILSANPAAERILGLSLDQMRGVTSLDPRWRAVREDGTTLPGEEHPAMVALQTGKPVYGFVMGVQSPAIPDKRWILVNAIPQHRGDEQQPYQVYATFEDITERYNLHTNTKTDIN